MNVDSIEGLIGTHPFFEGLDPAYAHLLAGCGRNVAFDRGDYLCREGEPADDFYLVRRGLVALELRVPDQGSIVIDTVGTDEVVGASWLVPPYRWQLDGRAVEPVGAVALDAACLRRKCNEDPVLGYDLLQRFGAVVVQRMASARLRLLDVYRGANVG